MVRIAPKCTVQRIAVQPVELKLEKHQSRGYCGELLGHVTIEFLPVRVRGVAVVMPPVYRQLYAKFSNVVEYPFEDRIMMRDTNPETGKLLWRKRFNVCLSSV